MSLHIDLVWRGPFRFGVGNERDLPPDESGVYIWAVPTHETRLLTYVGESQRLRSRWAEHVSWQLGGRYKIYDPISLRSGSGLNVVYEEKTAESLLLDFTESMQRAAWDNLVCCECYWATFDGDRALRRSVESAIHFPLRGKPEGRLIQNGSLSVGPLAARKVHCVLNWPDGIAIAGLPSILDYGQVKVGW